MRNALVYVLMNGKKHGVVKRALDPLSSAPWFDGFLGDRRTRGDPPVRPPETWLARSGWRKHGLLRPGERPKAPS